LPWAPIECITARARRRAIRSRGSMKLRKLLPFVLAVTAIACVPTASPTISPITLQPPTTTPALATTTASAPTDAVTLAPSPTSAPATSTAPGPTSAAPTASPNAVPTGTQAACLSTDQDQYVYHPSRLQVVAPCLRAVGVIDAIRTEADGDLHMLLRLDPEYVNLLKPANQGEELGDLVIEPICVKSVTQSDAIATCTSDHDPFGGPFPAVGQHVWMEGRYVLDLEHGSWAELHPLYRWGPEGGAVVNTVVPASTIPASTPIPVGPTQASQPTTSQVQPTASASGFTLTQLTSPVGRGGNVSATIRTAAGAACSIGYVTPSGNKSTAQGLVSETADANGVCAWTWKISSSTKPGTGTVTITANGSTQSFPIAIQ